MSFFSLFIVEKKELGEEDRVRRLRVRRLRVRRLRVRRLRVRRLRDEIEYNKCL
jgi:hypothetical protein